MSARKDLEEVRVRRRLVYRGRAVCFRADRIRLPNGNRAVREFMDHPGAVAALPLLGPRTIVLVEQYRYPVGTTTLEIPAGKLAPGEAPLRCLRRELREETGYRAARIRHLAQFWPTPAFSNELLRIYLAEGLTPGPSSPDEDEFLRVVRLPLAEALRRVGDGRIKDSKTVIALLTYRAQRR